MQAEIHSHLSSDKKTLLTEVDVSAKRNLLFVGGCTDTPVDLVAGGGNGQTVLMRTPTQVVKKDMWSVIKRDMWSVMEDFSIVGDILTQS